VKTYELIMETVLRKRYIRILHLTWFATYAAIFLIPFPPEMWNWGAFVFGWSGCLLPLLLSAGIFGNDVASGRISLLVTKPIRLGDLYLYRLLGLSLQGAVHLGLLGALILGLHRLTNRGNVQYFEAWLLASWLVFNTWAALSTSLSVVVKREHNAMLLFFGAAVIFAGLSSLNYFFPESRATALLQGVVRWACPPVELLAGLALVKHTLAQSLSDVGHSLMLTVFYSAIGIILLGRREYKRAGD
jgi:ABC-type transport system involved in multi-copper enzyme maturation permease subunit